MAFAQMMLHHMMGPRGPQTAAFGGNRSMVFTVNAGGGMHGMQFGAPIGGPLGGGCAAFALCVVGSEFVQPPDAHAQGLDANHAFGQDAKSAICQWCSLKHQAARPWCVSSF